MNMRARRTGTASDALMMKLLQSILDFLIRSGVKRDAIEHMFTMCLAQIETQNRSTRSITKESNYVGNGNVSAEVIRVWHRDSRYLDSEANPRPLALARGRRSLRKLIHLLDPAVDSTKAIQAMRAVGLIRMLPDGRFLPTAESVKIDTLHPLAIEHIAKSLVRLVTTVSRNTDPTRRAIPLIERYAYVPDLSRSEAKAFVDFTRGQGMAYLEAVDDWLEQRRARRLPVSRRRAEGKGVAAGVHLFAYLGDKGGSVSPNTRLTIRESRQSVLQSAQVGRERKRLTTPRAARV